MRRKQEDEAFWKTELEFCQRRGKFQMYGLFNGDKACFLRYVAMQAEFCKADGFEALARKFEEVKGY